MPGSGAARSRATSRRSSPPGWPTAFQHRRAVAFATALLLGAALGPASAAIVRPNADGAPWSAADVANLRADIDSLLIGSAALRGAHAGVLAIDTRSGATLYARNADDAFQPASTLKLLVGSAALERLGPAYRFHTDVLQTQDAVVLRGGGDPTLRAADLTAAARAIAAAGTNGAPRVFVDDSRYDRKAYPDGWTWDDFAQDYAVQPSAVTLDENVVGLTVAPGASTGAPALVRRNDGTPVEPNAGGCFADATSGVTLDARAVTGSATAQDSIDVTPEAGGCIAVVGTIPLHARATSVDAAVSSPLLAAYTAITAALQGAGITAAALPSDVPPMAAVRRSATSLDASPAVVWSRDSAALGTLLGPRFWIPSDNLFGELFLKELSYADGARPGSSERGTVVERRWLRAIGVDPASTTLADGSGLSQYDRITPRTLVAILQHDWSGPNRQLVLDSLPVGGARGTIEGIAGTAAAGRVFAKTGSMMHVRGLAGYLATRRHGAVTFAFSVDDWNGDYGALAALRAEVLERLVR